MDNNDRVERGIPNCPSCDKPLTKVKVTGIREYYEYMKVRYQAISPESEEYVKMSTDDTIACYWCGLCGKRIVDSAIIEYLYVHL